MGRGPKHNNVKPRSNGIFKVAGQNFKKEKKGKPKEVTSNLKLVRKSTFISGRFSTVNVFLDFPEK